MSVRRFLLRLIRDYPCARFVEAVTAYFEGTMPQAERARFERHMRGCDGCNEYLEQMRRTIELTGALREADVDVLPPDARDRLLAAFRGFHHGN